MRCIIIIIFLLFTNNVSAHQHGQAEEKIEQRARELLQNIFNDNSEHVTNKLNPALNEIQSSQSPRATVVSCSDSRVQSSTIDNTPINDLFYIRNIGNQIDTAIGSVKYGVRYLHTPVLLIIGHVGCGAVEAALGDYKQKPKAIRQELYTFDFPTNITAKDGVIHNVHNQVAIALKLFEEEIKKNKLVVIGTVYDFKNEYKMGYNRLILLNINGEKDPKVITKSKYLRGTKNVVVGVE
ncbi:Carbonic anhydrase [Candidatus Trichorickettsia mobilis]|uniref:carbonic anhydrase n=1 Tax=Candidatus Trichorickettsia mobilis TaxID=1346319 RepID=A0ABZ0UVJ5_9RICK|nr:carbonic anhydrase [Candidatus Trichorickettsia mobilis]WPY00939.1 Carbonic anhydrase [Candidatus Trichorickettsia mobilis]